MGMFDFIKCEYPLLPDGANEREYQTKDTPAQFVDYYEIRKDGTLWHEEYDIEDRSDPNAEGIEGFIGCMTRVNERWVQVSDFTGEIRFYRCNRGGEDWLEFSSYFLNGQIQQVNRIVTKDKSELN
ncbi:hypothetical protein BH09SUM1_BH09SUM1_02520 [soil metagenome]